MTTLSSVNSTVARSRSVRPAHCPSPTASDASTTSGSGQGIVVELDAVSTSVPRSVMVVRERRQSNGRRLTPSVTVDSLVPSSPVVTVIAYDRGSTRVITSSSLAERSKPRSSSASSPLSTVLSARLSPLPWSVVIVTETVRSDSPSLRSVSSCGGCAPRNGASSGSPTVIASSDFDSAASRSVSSLASVPASSSSVPGRVVRSRSNVEPVQPASIQTAPVVPARRFRRRIRDPTTMRNKHLCQGREPIGRGIVSDCRT